MEEYASLDPYAARSHVYYQPAVLNTLWVSKIVSYSEGWATFFQAVLRDLPNYLDTRSLTDTAIYVELERPMPDVPYYIGYKQTGPSNPTSYYDGADVEGAAIEALWDLYDNVDDGNYYVSSQIWGHNNDYNSGEPWVGVGNIWDVFWDFDPRPDLDSIDYCRTIYDFIHGWRSWGYPVDTKFNNIFQAHNVAVFVPGDVNNSGIINVADAVYLVQYIFDGGPTPLPVIASGDVNGSCAVNVADAVYLVQFIFGGGPSPVPGCS
jgi:hypothetical protein